jgi:intracellular sulfur oxidation DsrE/DsrF family protein
MKAIRRSLLTLFTTAALACSLPAGAAPEKPASAPAKERVVIQVSDNDPKRWALALNVASNIQKELGAEKVEVALVAFGPGIAMLAAEAEISNRVLDAMTSGVAVEACSNSMKVAKLGPDDLTKNVVVVPAGAVEIMKRQRAGWTYLRP